MTTLDLRQPKKIEVVWLGGKHKVNIMPYTGTPGGLTAFIQAHVEARLISGEGLKALI